MKDVSYYTSMCVVKIICTVLKIYKIRFIYTVFTLFSIKHISSEICMTISRAWHQNRSGSIMVVQGWQGMDCICSFVQNSPSCISYDHDQPLSLIICANSIINLPSLYFWLFSKACSYFQPSVVLQHSQKMSATACSPVSNTLSSAGPQPMFTTLLNRYALPWLPWNDLDINSSWFARCALQCTQL